MLARTRDVFIAAIAGISTMGLSLHYLLRDSIAPSISEFHLAKSYEGGGGTNVVNVILVDFRGFDTYGEIIVLGIAALLIYALTETLLSGPVRARLLNREPDQPRAGDIHPMMMVVLNSVFDASGPNGWVLHFFAGSQRSGRWFYCWAYCFHSGCNAVHGKWL